MKLQKHYRVIGLTFGFLLVLGLGFFFGKSTLAEDDATITKAIEEDTLEASAAIELAAVYAYQEMAMNGDTATLEKSALEGILADTSKEGLKLKGTTGSFVLNRGYIESLISQSEGPFVFSLALNGNQAAVSIKAEGSTLYGEKGLCLIEMKYNGGNETYIESPLGKVGVSTAYTDGGILRWQMVKAENYIIAQGSKNFSDMNNHWAVESVNYLTARGVVSGMSDTLFSPNATVTRGQFITFLARTAYDDYNAYTSDKFTDVSPSQYFYHAVSWGVEKGVINGVTESTFAPNAKVSRQDMAAMCSRYLDYLSVTVRPVRTPANFGDVGSISAYAQESVADGYNGGYINGKGSNTFDPKGNATRAEAVTMIAGMIYYITALPH